MLRTSRPALRRILTGTAFAGLVVTSLAVVNGPTAAVADTDTACGFDCSDGGSEGEADGSGISVYVWGSGTTAGEDGYEIPGETVIVLPPCYMSPWKTGKDYYEWYQKQGPKGPDNYPTEPPFPGYEKYKDDDKGYWWTGSCSGENYEGDDFTDYAAEWYEQNPPIYVEEGDPEPVPPIPPETLMQVAYDAMELPEPDIGWNPSRSGDGATFVNLDTWLWLNDGLVELEVNAEAGDNVARVEAVLGSMNYSAPNAAPVSCTGTGVEWTPGASSTDCSLVFERSSANQPGGVSRVLAESQWDIEWFANGEPQGALDPQTTTATFDIPVAEVQTVVTE